MRELIQLAPRRDGEHATGSSTRVVRALVLATPPSMSDGELTAKGSINARKVLTLRKDFSSGSTTTTTPRSCAL